MIDERWYENSTGLLSSQRGRSGSPLLTGLPDRTPKKRKAKETPLSADESTLASSVSDLGSRLEHAVDDRPQVTRFSKTPLKEHSDIGGDKGKYGFSDWSECRTTHLWKLWKICEQLPYGNWSKSSQLRTYLHVAPLLLSSHSMAMQQRH